MGNLSGAERKKIFEDQIGATSRKDFVYKNHGFFALINFTEEDDHEYQLSVYDVLETGNPLLTQNIGNQLNIRIDPQTGDILLVFEIDPNDETTFHFSRKNSPQECKNGLELADKAIQNFAKAKQYTPSPDQGRGLRGTGFFFG